MIFDAIIGVFTSVLKTVLGLIPDWAPPAGQFAAFGRVLGASFAQVQHYIPIYVLLSCVATLISFRIFLTLWHIIIFVYDKIPLKAT